MFAVEFETAIAGDMLQIPAHLLNQIPTHGQVKIILLVPEEKKNIPSQNVELNLKDELLKIGKNCAALPLLDNRTPNEILGYGKNGLPE